MRCLHRGPGTSLGDPYIKVDQGYARLPGAGYEALHPELEGTNPEDYPDIHKLAILADVAPYSREYQVSPSCLTQKPSRARWKTAAVPAHIPLPEMPPPGLPETQYAEPENELTADSRIGKTICFDRLTGHRSQLLVLSA